MFTFIYHSLIYTPLYNALIFFVKVVPLADAGIAVILLTILVRLILYPLSRKAVVTQVKMQEIGPALAEIKDKYKDKPNEQAKLTLALYKEQGVNPFSGILVLLIQLPIIWALYRIFLSSGLPTVNLSLLYSFIQAPLHVSVNFLGLINITSKSIILALLAAASTFFQLRLATKNQAAPKGDSFADNLTRNMQSQMKYFFPLIVFFISYSISGVIALYWLTTNLFTIGQEILVRRKLKKA